MPPIAQTIADELLPLIFRRGRPGYPGTPPFVPERQSFGVPGSAPNLLGPAQDPAPPVTVPTGMAPSQIAMPDETRPRIAARPALREELTSTPQGQEQLAAPVQQNVLAAEPPSPPMVSQSGQVMDESATRPARRVETDKRGRPTRNITMEGDEQTLDYADRVNRYEPQEGGGGWWPKIRAAIAGFAAGGPVGAAAAFGTRALREKFEPKLADEEWKRQQQGQIGPAVETIRQSRKDRLAERSTEANIDLAKARTDALKNPRQNARIIERKDGVYMLNTKTNKFERVEEIPPEANSPANARYFKAGNGEVWKIDAANPEGVRVRNIPGAPGKDSEDVGFSNAQIHQAIQEAQAEQAKIDQGMIGVPQTIEGTDILTGEKKMVANPQYTYNMTRRRQLDDDIRNWRLKLKSPKKASSSSIEAEDRLNLLFDEDDEP